jgi:hypothetical protein
LLFCWQHKFEKLEEFGFLSSNSTKIANYLEQIAKIWKSHNWGKKKEKKKSTCTHPKNGKIYNFPLQKNRYLAI